MVEMGYLMKISGEKMAESVVIRVIAESNIQAMFKAKEEANNLSLNWDEIEFL